jgi:hypothetical protein
MNIPGHWPTGQHEKSDSGDFFFAPPRCFSAVVMLDAWQGRPEARVQRNAEASLSFRLWTPLH